MKICPRCNNLKNISDFYHPPCLNGRCSSYCKECLRLRSKMWKKEHPMLLKESKRRYQIKHKKDIHLYWKNYYEKNKYRLRKNTWRFEILTRDGFTCRYCGRKPPEVELEIDHINPRSKGGTNHLSNLITACRDCNAGKYNNELTRSAPR